MNNKVDDGFLALCSSYTNSYLHHTRTKKYLMIKTNRYLGNEEQGQGHSDGDMSVCK